MNIKRLGCLTTGGLISFAIVFIIVGASYAYAKNQMFSPGVLSGLSSERQIGGVNSHSDLEASCQTCHPAPWDQKGMSNLCLDCHTEVNIQISNLHSLHGAAISVLDSNDCRICHTDHQGYSADITVYEGLEFPHYLIGFSLTSHQDLFSSEDIMCTDCHPGSLVNFDQSSCLDCHLKENREFIEDHTFNFNQDCLACHDGIESINSSFDHNQVNFNLAGEHAEILCQDCHIKPSDLAAFKDTSITCYGCHMEDDLHLGFLGHDCNICHTSISWIPARYDHTQTGFFLNGGHSDLFCSACHPDPTFQGLSPECYSCHEDYEPHLGEFGTVCTICHSVVSWDFIDFDHSGPYSENCSYCHQKDSPFGHYQGQCSACHILSGWLPATFNHAVANATDCVSCHIQNKPANHFAGQCSLCHSTARWKPATINHTFPVSHEGANNRCNLCHPGNNYYTYSCYQCHEHSRSEVKKEHEGISNLDNCIRCHWDGRKHDDGGDDDD